MFGINVPAKKAPNNSPIDSIKSYIIHDSIIRCIFVLLKSPVGLGLDESNSILIIDLYDN